ncbi:MAG: signal peptidase I [Chloroflexi bacterium]|nr:signal peptidase I [Chloroflexota bacterium]MCL5274356.1 signal peptidase I [Chloroflexota bacterium]
MESTGNAELSVEPASGETVDAEVIGASPRLWWRSLAEIAVMVLIIIFVANILAVQTEMVGTSMSPALNAGDEVLASRITYVLLAPERGDVVIMRDPLNPNGDVVRRVIGLPGERVEIRGSQVLINGQPLVEDYTGNPLTVSSNLTTSIQIQLQPSEYYVLGDNRLSINDSRSWGPIPGADILGRAWLVYWPPDSISAIQQQRYAPLSDR